MNQVLADALEKLWGAQGRLASSALTASQRRELDAFARQTGSVRQIPQGCGSLYQTSQPEIVRQHLKHLRPHLDQPVPTCAPPRSANIARNRDSKSQAHSHATHYLLLKAIQPGVAWRQVDQPELELSTLCELTGAGVLAIQPEDDWHSEQPLWLVENQALFDRLDWLPTEATGSVAYYGGQLSNLLLDWLANRPRASKIVFFPDYDGVGLLNYARLLEKAALPCEFWLMPNWQDLLKTYGNRAIWERTFEDFQRAQTRLARLSVTTEIQTLCKTLAHNGLALEHEVVWLGNYPV